MKIIQNFFDILLLNSESLIFSVNPESCLKPSERFLLNMSLSRCTCTLYIKMNGLKVCRVRVAILWFFEACGEYSHIRQLEVNPDWCMQSGKQT